MFSSDATTDDRAGSRTANYTASTIPGVSADSDDVARVYRFDLAQDSERTGCAKTPPVSRACPAILRLLNGKQL